VTLVSSFDSSKRFEFRSATASSASRVLYRGARDFTTLGASLFGIDSADRVSNGLALIWPSDHASMVATLQIQN
jgi:hypothetical protein